jgi:hypothetical protein
VSSLTGTYEDELFTTWSYDKGEYLEDPSRFPDARAHWTVQNAEADRLEVIARQVDILLEALQRNPLCKGIVEAVRCLLRNNGRRWRATELPWTYVKHLDQLLNALTLACREAKVVSGNDAAERDIGQIRPLRETTADVTGSCGLQNSQGETAPDGSTSKDERSSPVDLRSTPSKVDSCTSDKPQQASASPGQLLPTESPQESGLTVHRDHVPEEGNGGVEQGIAVSSHTTDAVAEVEPPLSSPTTESVMEYPIRPASSMPTSLTPAARNEQTSVDGKSPEEPLQKAEPPDRDAETDEAEPVNQRTVEEPTIIRRDIQEDQTVPDKSMMREPQQNRGPQTLARRMDATEQEDQSGYTEAGSPTPQKACRAEPASKASEVTNRSKRSRAGTLADSARSPQINTDGAAVPTSHEKPQQQSEGQAEAISTSPLGRTNNPLLLRLLDHHGCLRGTKRSKPISSVQLQRDLGWPRSKVQRAMSDIFGTKPFRVYNEKCKDRIITVFLKEFANQKREVLSQRGRGLCVSTR